MAKNLSQAENRAEKKAERRAKKGQSKMKVSGKGMKRFANPKKSGNTLSPSARD